MEPTGLRLLGDINKKLKQKPLIYFCKEAERAIGIEDVLKNYHICCIENTQMVKLLRNAGHSIFCLEEIGITLKAKQSLKLIDIPQVKTWIKKIAPSGFYALTFKPVKAFEFKITKLGGRLLAPAYEISSELESKTRVHSFFNEYEISTPNSLLIFINDESYITLNKIFGETFVVQTERANTGAGTYFVTSNADFESLQKKLAGNIVKVSEHVHSNTYTINGVISNTANYYGALQQQITGIALLGGGKGSTLGNNFHIYFAKDIVHDITVELKKLGHALKDKGYRGIFGVDFMIKDNKPVIIEINARQPASVPFESTLTLLQNNQAPLQLLHIAHSLNISLVDLYFENFRMLKGSQIFLRTSEDVSVKTGLNTGSYAEYNLKQNTYKLSQETNALEYILLTQQMGSRKKMYDEIARIQTLGSIIDGNTVDPWVYNRLIEIKNQII